METPLQIHQEDTRKEPREDLPPLPGENRNGEAAPPKTAAGLPNSAEDSRDS